MIPRLLKRELILILVLASLFFGCRKEEFNTLRAEISRQEELLQALQNYMQVVRVENKKGKVVITFSNGETIFLVSDFTPILSISEKGTWLLNGNDTGIRADVSEGSVESIDLRIGTNGNWFLNGIDTGQKSYAGTEEEPAPQILSVRITDAAIFLYMSDSSVLYVPVNQDPMSVVPQYFMEQLTAKEEAVRQAMESAGKEQAGFIFFTDAHWGRNQKHSPAIIKHIVDNTNISKVFFGGDVITSNSSSVKEALDIGYAFQKAFSFLGPDFYCVYGNHDSNSNAQWDRTELHLSDAQVYSYLQSQMTGLEVTYGDYFNFYVDHPLSRTRYICIDSGRFFTSVYYDFRVPTAEFIISALTDVPMGWNIIFVGHIWNDFIKILDDYNHNKQGVYKYGQSAPYDFTNASSTIKFCVGGHIHKDLYQSTPEGIPIMIMDTDSQITSTVEESRTGTIGEQCVTAFVADYQKDSVFLFRVGRGEDARIKMYSPN